MALTDETLKAVAVKAIFDSISPEDRMDLLQKAIRDLIIVPDKPSSTYGYSGTPKSKLQEAFDTAVYRVCQELATDMVKNDPDVRARIKAVFDAAITKTFDPSSTTYDKLISEVGDKMSRFLKGELKSDY